MNFQRFNISDAIRHFPAPSFWKYQKEAITEITEAFNSDYRAILLDSPTGSGKTLLNTTFAKMFKKTFYTTPQLILIDQILNDNLIRNEYEEIKGRQNYICVMDKPTRDLNGKLLYTTVDVGKCIRSRKFKCHNKNSVCRYYIQKARALASKKVLMSLKYFMTEGAIGEMGFGRRELLILDESHSLDNYIIDQVQFEVSIKALNATLYNIIKPSPALDIKDESAVKNYLSIAIDAVTYEMDDLLSIDESQVELSVSQIKLRDKVKDFLYKAETFVGGNFDGWVCGLTRDQRNNRIFEAKPLYAAPFGKKLIWDRADYYIISSATILPTISKESGLTRVLEKDQIYHCKVPSTFPPENRPIIPMLAGKMTRSDYKTSFPTAIKNLESIFEIEKDINFVVHCHSYENSRRIQNAISEKYKTKIIAHYPYNREIKLKEFIKKGKKSPQIFLSVAFEEGQDWVGEICEGQALFKIPYPHVGDERVKKRLELNDWSWYFSETLKKVIQTYGRAVRNPTDKANFYIIDSSFVDLISRTRKIMPDWFSEALPRIWSPKQQAEPYKGVKTVPKIMNWKPPK